MKCRLLRSGSCRLEKGVWFHTQWFISKYQSHGVRSPASAGVAGGRHKSWLHSRRLHPDGPLNNQCGRAPDNIEPIYRFPWGCASLLLLPSQIAGSAAAHREWCEGILYSLCRCIPNSGGLIVARLLTREDRKIRQGQSWWVGRVCSCQHLANDARHHRHPGISLSPPPVCSCSHTGPSVSLQNTKEALFHSWIVWVFLWAANQRLATWFTKPSQRSVKCISNCTGNPVCSESPCSGSACPRLNVI